MMKVHIPAIVTDDDGREHQVNVELEVVVMSTTEDGTILRRQPARIRTMGDPDVCSRCGSGRLKDGVVSLPNECCAIYFYGYGSWAHNQWVSFSRYCSLRAALPNSEGKVET